MDLDPGTIVANRYRISRPLGRGGMGEVFAAENIRTGRPVAIKLLRQDSKTKTTAIARFRQEARAAGQINSDHVTQVLDVEEDPEHGVVLVFELLEGESLIDRLKRTGPVPFDELWSIIEQVWMGLADAHRAGIIHRDLKPSNVFLERRPDGTTRVKILDFGISKVPKEVGGETLTEMGQSLGTFSFMPPEQIGKAKTVDHRADIYACATLIYQSLTGQLPYSARNILVMVEMKSKTDARKLGDAMPGPVDPRLEAFVARGLARDASQRFATALEALNAWRDLRPPSGPSSTQPQSGQAPTSGQPASGAGTGQSARPRSQPPTHAASNNSSPSLPRAPTAPVIMEGGGPLPRVNGEPVEMTTEETAATLHMAIPAFHRKPQAAQGTPPLAPRLDAAAASLGGTVQQSALAGLQLPRAPLGPGGTQPVGVGRSLDHLKMLPDVPPPAHDPRGGNLPVHPAGYYLSPAVAASLARPEEAPAPPEPPRSPATGPSGLPRTYDEPAAGEGEGRTQVYRPEDTGRRAAVAPPGETPRPRTVSLAEIARVPVPIKARRGVPLLVVLIGFLLMGFVVVAGVMALMKR